MPSLRSGIGKIAGFVGRHPMTLIGGAAAAGIYSAHPWRSLAGAGALVGLPTKPWATNSTISDMFLGDPDAVAKITRGAATGAVANIASPYNNPNIPYNGGPSGSIVFGLYNDRLK